MKFKVITLFPEMFPGPLTFSLAGKAISKKLFEIETINIRDFSEKKSKTVDDTPYGGGAGMILKPEIMQKSLEFAKKNSAKNKKIVCLSPSGKKLNQELVKKLKNFEELILICGRYEGIDNRFIEFNEIEEISVGDYILSGGEIASFILIDACVRLIPEVLGNKDSLNSESFRDHLLAHPQYTKPFEWMGVKVPNILLSGNHQKISEWRLKKSLEKTKKVRPDLFELYVSKSRGKK
ncbi:MAG: tRNA (guanosine(37)-N1)-methyltransferase TrmD [Pseudomonadota bacterium]|nr:tRNA (guanosine(37)-N1)-methyltransferase TrmD [Pseudomonadota bacterium]